MRNIILGQVETYTATPNVWSFKKVEDIVNGFNLRLTNMAGGFPFEFNDTTWKDSERLYLCGEYSNDTDRHRQIQQALLDYTSGYAAKRFGKARYRKEVREDFPSFRLQWMLFCVWQKCKGNSDFRELLLSIPEYVTLVENTTTDKWESATIWGCKNPELHNQRVNLEKALTTQHQGMNRKELDNLINIETNKVCEVGEWKGQNNIGKILMICRDCIAEGMEPTIDYELLRSANIHLLGQKLTF
ncbi:MAG: NADAR family protein [Prevotella sp.]|nr:NADAR family protein [Prevotella sp.]